MMKKAFITFVVVVSFLSSVNASGFKDALNKNMGKKIVVMCEHQSDNYSLTGKLKAVKDDHIVIDQGRCELPLIYIKISKIICFYVGKH